MICRSLSSAHLVSNFVINLFNMLLLFDTRWDDRICNNSPINCKYYYNRCSGFESQNCVALSLVYTSSAPCFPIYLQRGGFALIIHGLQFRKDSFISDISKQRCFWLKTSYWCKVRQYAAISWYPTIIVSLSNRLAHKCKAAHFSLNYEFLIKHDKVFIGVDFSGDAMMIPLKDNQDVASFLVTKHSWKGKYKRVFSVGTHGITTYNPDRLEVTNKWLYSDVITVASAKHSNSAANHDFTLVMKKDKKVDTMKFSSEHKCLILTEAFKYRHLFAEKPKDVFVSYLLLLSPVFFIDT